MWDRLLDLGLTRLIQTGALELTYPDGTTRQYGQLDQEPVRARMQDPAMPRGLLLAPDMTVGDGYMDGTLTFGQDDLPGFMTLIMRNRMAGAEPAALDLWRRLAGPSQRWLARNNPLTSRTNVAHHYDLSSDMYRLFLDSDMQYSCAYFTDPTMTLEAAQEAKKQHIAAKLCLRPGMRVLDIGCGWGGMALTLARDHGVIVTGVTLSQEQYRIGTERVAAAGLQDRVTLLLQDYRSLTGPFDRIVSVGMFEHVGAAHFREYFDKVRALLPPDGVALIHTIGTQTPPRPTSPWIRARIFPGGYLPSMSETVLSIEKAGLYPTDIEVLRLHYAYTLRHWHDRFNDHLDEVRAMYDDRFVRMWKFYLTAAELSFVHERLAVFQFQIGRDKTAVPITRDYLYDGT